MRYDKKLYDVWDDNKYEMIYDVRYVVWEIRYLVNEIWFMIWDMRN